MIYAHDPGGINVIIPIIEYLNHIQSSFDVYSNGLGRGLFLRRGIDAIDITAEVQNTSVEDVRRFVELKDYNLVLTGTSAIDLYERYLWKASEHLGIKSFALLDHWINYKMRFSLDCNRYHYLSECQIDVLPSKIMVMDDLCKEEMISEGFDTEQLIVVGNTILHQLFNRKSINKENNGYVVLFCEPLGELYKSNDTWGFDEYDVIRELSQVLLKFMPNKKLLIKPHPKQKLDILRVNGNISHGVVWSLTELNAHDLIAQCDVIVGTFTMAIVEAVVMSKPIINIIPNSQAFEKSILFRKKVIHPIKSANEYNLENLVSLSDEEILDLFNIRVNPVEKILKELGVQ